MYIPPRAEARGIYSSLKEVDLLASLPLEVVAMFNIINQTKYDILKTNQKGEHVSCPHLCGHLNILEAKVGKGTELLDLVLYACVPYLHIKDMQKD